MRWLIFAKSVSDPQGVSTLGVVTAVSSNPAVIAADGLCAKPDMGVRLDSVEDAIGVTTIMLSVSDGTMTYSRTFDVTVLPMPEGDGQKHTGGCSADVATNGLPMLGLLIAIAAFGVYRRRTARR